MGERRKTSGEADRGSERKPEPVPPIPLDAVDLLAGIAPGVQLCADDSPLDAPDDEGACVSVAEVGRMLRSGDSTVRRLIRTPAIKPKAPPAEPREPMRAGVPPRSRERPGE